jgi:glycerate 2-kinase
MRSLSFRPGQSLKPSTNFSRQRTSIQHLQPTATLRQHLGAIVSAALAAVEARRVTLRALRSLSDELDRVRSFHVVAAGKAAAGMARAASEALGDRIVAGIVTTVTLDEGSDARWKPFAASHPVPSAESEAAGRAALALANQVAGPDDRLLVCLSGGASAMLVVPAPGIALEDKQLATNLMLRSGLDIGALNVVRRHLSAIKGGQLAARASRTVTLAISDVSGPVEDDPSAVGSGPTVGDASSFADAIAIVEQYGLRKEMPAAVMRHLDAGARGQVSGPVPLSDDRLAGSAYWIVGSRQDAMQAAADAARRIGYHVHVRGAAIGGPARDAGRFVADEVKRLDRPACVITSGETTVHVKGTGRGGRNQELALSLLEQLSGLAPAALASVGTDGVDGPTDAAGAFVDSEMWNALGGDAREVLGRALDQNDSYPLLERLGALVRTGPTGTNVGDLQVLLLG